MTNLIDPQALQKIRLRAFRHSLPDDHFYHDLMNRLLSRLDYIKISPTTILNIGWHTACAQKALQERYPAAIITQANPSVDLANFSADSVDLIVAHFPLLTESQPKNTIKTLSRLLRQEGLLLLTSVGPDTLYELRESFSDQYPHVHTFQDMHFLGDWLRDARLTDPVVDREEITMAYDALDLLFQDLKQLKITNLLDTRRRGLLSSHQWKKMLSHYATNFKTEDYFPATIEMIYGHAWKGMDDENFTEENHDVYIAIDHIQRKKN